MQLESFTGQLLNHVSKSEEYQDVFRAIKEPRITAEKFKEILNKIKFPLATSEKFDGLLQVFESSVTHAKTKASAPLEKDPEFIKSKEFETPSFPNDKHLEKEDPKKTLISMTKLK